jgi:hypothetical protein
MPINTPQPKYAKGRGGAASCALVAASAEFVGDWSSIAGILEDSTCTAEQGGELSPGAAMRRAVTEGEDGL